MQIKTQKITIKKWGTHFDRFTFIRKKVYIISIDTEVEVRSSISYFFGLSFFFRGVKL